MNYSKNKPHKDIAVLVPEHGGKKNVWADRKYKDDRKYICICIFEFDTLVDKSLRSQTDNMVSGTNIQTKTAMTSAGGPRK